MLQKNGSIKESSSNSYRVAYADVDALLPTKTIFLTAAYLSNADAFHTATSCITDAATAAGLYTVSARVPDGKGCRGS